MEKSTPTTRKMQLKWKTATDWTSEDRNRGLSPAMNFVAGWEAARKEAAERFELAFRRNDIVEDVLSDIEKMGEEQVE